MIRVEKKVFITLELDMDNARAFRDDLNYILTSPRVHSSETESLHELLTKTVGNGVVRG